MTVRLISASVGSPPHMRGKGHQHPDWHGRRRITPAHAGKRTKHYKMFRGVEDHPRTCGEKEAKQLVPQGEWGSPPHMRGKVSSARHTPHGHRITPAHAGKSRAAVVVVAQAEDHPRTCGEKAGYKASGECIAGSPPHMRGKAASPPPGGMQCGITPAHAGKRARWPQSLRQIWDHPRTCGEKTVPSNDA